MHDMRRDDWTRLVRQHVEAAGRFLSAEVIEELAEHLADVYAGEREAGRSAVKAREAAETVLRHGAFDEIAGRRRARREAGSRLIERSPQRPGRIWVDVGFDVRYAWRSMRRQTAFSLAVLAILAVGIGATTAAYAVVDGVLLRPLPYPGAGRLFVMRHVTPEGEGRSFSAADWLDYSARHAASMDLAAYASWPMNITGGGEPERLRSVIVSGNFFDVAGLPPALGRAGARTDDVQSAPAVVVLSDGFWRRRFGGEPSAIGDRIVLNGRPATIVGVMPPGFALPGPDVDLWSPMGLAPEVLADRAGEWLSLFGRLRPGIDRRVAQADLSVTAAALAASFPETNTDERAVILPMMEEMTRGVRRPLWLGSVAALFLLLAGCANAANLMIARATLRRDEIAIRSALGAEPGRLARQLLVESAVLASVGGALGLVAAGAFLQAFVALADGRVPRIDQVQLNAGSLVVTFGTSLATALLFGGAAAWLLVRDASIGARGDLWRVTRSNRLGRCLLAGQVAFAMILIAGALLVVGSYARTVRIDPGFDTSDTLTMQLTLPREAYPDAPARVRFAERALAEIAGIPGGASAGVVSDLPFVANAMHFDVRAEGAPPEAAQPMTVRLADAGFFRTLRIPQSSGRPFDARDRAGAPLVAIVNQTAANRLGNGTGGAARLQVSGEPPRTVVGVVGDIKHAGLLADEGPVVYVPYSQTTFGFVNWMGIVVRGSRVEGAVPDIRNAIARVDPDLPLVAVRSMTDYMTRETAPFQFGALIVGSLAGAALVLAVTGVYGLTAFIVGRRTRELGVRLALGATRARILRLVLGQVAWTVLFGAAAGAAGSAITNGMLRVALDEAGGSGDLTVLFGGGALFTAMTLVAAVAPALRAARIDPRAALQAE